MGPIQPWLCRKIATSVEEGQHITGQVNRKPHAENSALIFFLILGMNFILSVNFSAFIL